jgi:hypothetical protein
MDYKGDDTMMRFAFSILCAIAAGIGLLAGCLPIVDIEMVVWVIAVGMTIDVQAETIISFADARSAFPGIDRRLSLATLHRWRLTGVRGVKLETILIGGLRYTSREALVRFVNALNAADAPAAPVITASQRRKQSEAARTELEKMGVSGGVSRTIARPTKDSIATTGVAKQ